MGQEQLKLSVYIIWRLGLDTGWRREVVWERESALLLRTLSASTFPSL